MTVPVVFLVFNRPECTTRVFAAIRQARPSLLLVVADGPRAGQPDDVTRCAAVRRLIDEGVDWPCTVERNYSETNLGCARRVASGLDWAFSRAERLIVLEDDCLPDPSFFPYCEELLERYKDNTKIGQICGSPRYISRIKRPTSYIFSHYGPIWGWASWKRVWRHYDLEMKSWPEVRRTGALRAFTQSEREFKQRTALYDKLYSSIPTTWDYQWGYAKLVNHLLCIIPTANLVENIGFGPDGTHLHDEQSKLKQFSLQQPLIHPVNLSPDIVFDRYFSQSFTQKRWSINGMWHRIRSRCSRFTSIH